MGENCYCCLQSYFQCLLLPVLSMTILGVATDGNESSLSYFVEYNFDREEIPKMKKGFLHRVGGLALATTCTTLLYFAAKSEKGVWSTAHRLAKK